MEEALELLKKCSIISAADIESLRHIISIDHPSSSEVERAQVFAAMLHQKLDAALALFDAPIQKHIKRTLIEQTVTKKDFAINALDIVETYVHLEDSTNVTELTSWVNQFQEAPLSEEAILSLTQHLIPLCASDTLPQIVASTEIPSPKAQSFSIPMTIVKFLGCVLMALVCIVGIFHFSFSKQLAVRNQLFNEQASFKVTLPISIELIASANYLQSHLQYKPVNETALKNWLLEKHSLLATEPYFSTFLETAKNYNINPLLLFAITGQEQNFVPMTHESAQKIANNPFNLYGSWQNYNTSIEDATQIVARTIIHLGKDCPDEQDQIKWINREYAADPNWSVGVSYFLNELEIATSGQVESP